MPARFPKTLAAADALSHDRKELAAALWEEIPPVRRGGSAARDAVVGEAIAQAGRALGRAGHDYTPERLKNIRAVAGWVADGNVLTSGDCPWRDEWTFSVHEVGYNSGKTFDEFKRYVRRHVTRTVTGRITVDAVRISLGLRPTRVSQQQPIGPQLTREQRVEVAREVMSDPAVVHEVVADRRVRDTTFNAIVNDNRERTEARRRPDVTAREREAGLDIDLWGLFVRVGTACGNLRRHLPDYEPSSQDWRDEANDTANVLEMTAQFVRDWAAGRTVAAEAAEFLRRH